MDTIIPAKILVADDERNLTALLRSYLEAEGYEVFEAHDGPSTLRLAAQSRPDVVVLDLIMPGIDGVEVCRQLRQFSNAYVLMLTSKSQEVDKLIGLSVGADDYMTKPFSPRELVARVKAMLRRAQMGEATGLGRLATDIPAPVVFGELVIDTARHEVQHGGEVIYLTPREFELLATLSAHPGLVFTRRQLLNRVWGDDLYEERLVDVHIASLRKKLHDESRRPRYIETVRGVGFRFGPRSTGATRTPGGPRSVAAPSADPPAGAS
jgi:DNA-binding response OmpR family regulator